MSSADFNHKAFDIRRPVERSIVTIHQVTAVLEMVAEASHSCSFACLAVVADKMIQDLKKVYKDYSPAEQNNLMTEMLYLMIREDLGRINEVRVSQFMRAEAVGALVKAGADPNANGLYDSFISDALSHGSSPLIIKALADAGAQLRGTEVFTRCFEYHRGDAARELVPLLKEENLPAALKQAARYGYTEIVEAILHRGKGITDPALVQKMAAAEIELPELYGSGIVWQKEFPTASSKEAYWGLLTPEKRVEKMTATGATPLQKPSAPGRSA